MSVHRHWLEHLASAYLVLAGFAMPRESLAVPYVPFPSQQSLREAAGGVGVPEVVGVLRLRPGLVKVPDSNTDDAQRGVLCT